MARDYVKDTVTEEPKRLLMVSAAFPPTGGSGVQRTVKFAKYLPRFGWLPQVWSLDRIPELPADPTLLDDLGPEVSIHRSDVGLRRRSWSRALIDSLGRTVLPPRIASGLKRCLGPRSARRSFPDEFAGWADASIEPLVRLIEEQGVDAIYSTFSPPSNHLLAMALQKRSRLPWVADFRDLWTDDFRYRERSPGTRQADRDLEQRILETADAVIGVTPSQTQMLADRVPGHRRRFRTITNGYDPDDFRDLRKPTWVDDRTFVLSFVGRFERYRAHASLFAGLKRFVSGLGQDRDRFVFRVVGHADRVTRAAVRETGIRHDFVDYVSHGEAIREMAGADALLLSIETELPNTRTIIRAKVFEYLAAHRPILVVGPSGGESERIVRSCDAGLTVPFDEEAVAAAVQRLYTAWAHGQPIGGCDPSHLGRYNRVTLTGNLAAILDGLVGQAVAPIARNVDRRDQVLVAAGAK